MVRLSYLAMSFGQSTKVAKLLVGY